MPERTSSRAEAAAGGRRVQGMRPRGSDRFSWNPEAAAVEPLDALDGGHWWNEFW